MTTQDERHLERGHANDASVRIAIDTVGRVLSVFWAVVVLGLMYILSKRIIGMPWYYVPHPSESESGSQVEADWGLEPSFFPESPPSERYTDDPVTEDPEIH